jgi:hypothetical protein
MKSFGVLSLRLALWTGLFAFLFLVLAVALVYFLIPDQLPPPWFPAAVAPEFFQETVMAAVAGVVVFGWLILWLILRRSCRKSLQSIAVPASPPRQKTGKTEENDEVERKQRLHHDKRRFLHLVSVLQIEGRFLDFLNENLDQYEDAQIGAAARGVHERCKQALAKYLVLEPLAAKAEGEVVTVPVGFDSGGYRLSGNVTGDPPFEGRLTHKGWRAGRLNMPDFAFSGDPEIIAPMEVCVD